MPESALNIFNHDFFVPLFILSILILAIALYVIAIRRQKSGIYYIGAPSDLHCERILFTEKEIEQHFSSFGTRGITEVKEKNYE